MNICPTSAERHDSFSTAKPVAPAELETSIAAYDADPDYFVERYAQVDVTSIRETFVGALRQPGPILDAGCGTGRDLAAFTATGRSLYGVDLSVGLLQKAAQVIPPGRLIQCDMRDMPFDDDMFAGIWAMSSLVHLNHDGTLAALREFERLLKCDGTLCVTLKAADADNSEWLNGRWFAAWSEATALSFFNDAMLNIDKCEYDDGSIGGGWWNIVASADPF